MPPHDDVKSIDNAVRPSHYKSRAGTIEMEVIDVIEAFDVGFALGNSIKYILRAGHKGDRLTDLRKAAFYLQREIATEERTRTVKA